MTNSPELNRAEIFVTLLMNIALLDLFATVHDTGEYLFSTVSLSLLSALKMLAVATVISEDVSYAREHINYFAIIIFYVAV